MSHFKKKSNNSDNTLQIKPTFWWVKGLLPLKKQMEIHDKLSRMIALLEFRKKRFSRIRKLACCN